MIMTTEIRFYHLLRQSVDQAAPMLIDKAMATGKKMQVLVPDARQVQHFSQLLWGQEGTSFIAHGTEKGDQDSVYPLWISSDIDNVNDAKIVISLNGATLSDEGSYDLCCYVFDGNDGDALQDARQRWKSYKESDFTLTYWQQGDSGWEKKA